MLYLLLLPPLGGIVIGHVCWLVLHLLIVKAHCDFSKSKSPVILKFGAPVKHLGQISLNFCIVKVKVQGHTENLSLAVTRPCFKMSFTKFGSWTVVILV